MGYTGFLSFAFKAKEQNDMKYIVSLLILVSILVLNTSQSLASWLIYHKPEFRGKVIDAESKEPIEGAVVVVVYKKENFGYPAGGYTTVVKVKETLTDKNGEFDFPSYTTVIQPLSAESYAEFIIYKPGYDTFPGRGTMLSGLGLDGIETFFSNKIGSEGELEVMFKGGSFKMVKVKFGIVELPKMKTREERLRAITSPSGRVKSKDIPLLDKAINEEYRRFGLNPGTVGEE